MFKFSVSVRNSILHTYKVQSYVTEQTRKKLIALARSAIATSSDCVAHCCLVRINNTWHYAFNLKTSKCILKWNTVYHIKGTNVDILFGWVQAAKQQTATRFAVGRGELAATMEHQQHGNA